MTIFEAIVEFIEGVFSAIGEFIMWTGDVAEALQQVEFQTAEIQGYVGLYRYLVGDALYSATITAMYISVILMAMRVIPIFISWWKRFSPMHS